MSQVAKPARYLSPPQVARRLGVDPHRVVRWIRNGELVGINLGDGPQRPRYRISESDLAVFLASRAAGPTAKVARRRRRDPTVCEFF